MLDVVCRVPQAGISCELLYGLPLIAGAAAGDREPGRPKPGPNPDIPNPDIPNPHVPKPDIPNPDIPKPGHPEGGAGPALALAALVGELRTRREALVLKGPLCPATLGPARAGYFFAALPAEGGEGPALALHGLASEDACLSMSQFCIRMSEYKLWYIAALLQKPHSEKPHLEAPKRTSGSLRRPCAAGRSRRAALRTAPGPRYYNNRA